MMFCYTRLAGILFLVFMIWIPAISIAQEAEEGEIETDRDSFTPSTNVVGQGRSVLETSYSFIDNRKVRETHSLPELLFRYGIGENMELRLGANYEIGGAGSPISANGPNTLESTPELEAVFYTPVKLSPNS